MDVHRVEVSAGQANIVTNRLKLASALFAETDRHVVPHQNVKLAALLGNANACSAEIAPFAEMERHVVMELVKQAATLLQGLVCQSKHNIVMGNVFSELRLLA